jgi:NAD(P)H-dependent FMN reductase
VAGSDAIVVVSPEYNGGYSPALKNAIDYIDPAHFRRKAWGTVTVSNGPMGGMRAAQALHHLALALFAVPCPQMLLVGSVEQKVAEDGTVADPSIERGLGNFRREFLWLAKALASARVG